MKGAGGYVVAAGSAHPSGATHQVERDMEPAPIPAWLADVLADERGPTTGTPFELPDRIPTGARDETLWRYACSLRGKGVKITQAVRAMQEAWKRCEQPPGSPYPWEHALEKIDRAWGYDYTPTPDPPTSTIGDGSLHIVSIEEFAAVIEDGAGPLLGEHSQAVIAENSDVVIYGDGGASKTTLMIDLAFTGPPARTGSA